MTQVIITSGTSFTIPGDWTNVNTIEAIGGGQASNSSNCNGGAGAYYCKISNEADSGTVSIAIGAGGSSSAQAGGNTTWKTTVTAPGGGSATTPVGTTQNAGGAGGTSSSASNYGGGGGGGAGGPNGAGKAGGNSGNLCAPNPGAGGGGAGGGSSTAGSGVTSSLSGAAGGTAQDGTAGGAGATSSSAAGNGSNGSGGGGGHSSTGHHLGGAGGNGIEWGSAGAGGGSGGATGGSLSGTGSGTAGLYGGGGGGQAQVIGCIRQVDPPTAGAQGVIVVTYVASPLLRPVAAAVLAVIASFAPPDNGPYFGAGQPYGPKLLNPSIIAVPANPPPPQDPGSSAAGQAITAQAWQPDPWVYNILGQGAFGPYMPRVMPAAITGQPVNNPPFSHAGRNPLPGIVQAWQPDPWVFNLLGQDTGQQPYGAKQLPPSITAVPVNEPPYQNPGRTPNANIPVALWQPDPWVYTYTGPAGGFQPYAARLLNPSVTNNPPDNPPFRNPGRIPQTNVPLWYWQPEAWPYVFTSGNAVNNQPYSQQKLTPVLFAVVVNNPPFTYPARIQAQAAITTQWQPDPWVYNELGQQGGAQPYGQRNLNPFYTAVEVDNPPFGIPNKSTLAGVVGGWQPDPWVYNYSGNVSGTQPYGPKQLSPGIPGQSVDPPPPIDAGRLAVEGAIVTIWQPDPWVFTFNGSIQAQPYGVRLTSPAIPGQSVDQPPYQNPGRRPQANVPVWQWQPPEWPYTFTGGYEPYSQNKLTPSITAVPITINYRKTVRNVIVRINTLSSNPWPGKTYPPSNNP